MTYSIISRRIFFNRFTRVSLAKGQTSPISVQSVDGHYNCCTTVLLWLYIFFNTIFVSSHMFAVRTWKVELYTRLRGFGYEISKWGEGFPSPPQIPPSLNLGLRFRFGLWPQILGALRPQFGLHPDTLNSPPLGLIISLKQGKLLIYKFTTLPQLLSYAIVFLTQFLCQAICTQRTPKGPE